MLGNDAPGAAEEAQAILVRTLVDPPRTGLAYFYGLLAEMFLAAGKPARAGAVLDLADRRLDTFGERYAEGLLRLLRARQLQASGEPTTAVRAAADEARAVSVACEARLFARRAAQFLATLEESV